MAGEAPPGAGRDVVVTPVHGRRVADGATWLSWVAGVVASVAIGLAVVSLLIWGAQGFPDLPQSFSRTPLAIVPLQVQLVTGLLVGALLVRRVPHNPVGWLLLAAGLALATILPAALLVAESHEALRPAPGPTRLAAWVASTLSTPLVLGSLALAGLLFPDGRLGSRASRVAALLIVAAAIMFATVAALDPVGLVWYPTVPNPIAAPGEWSGVFQAARAPSALLLLAALCSLVFAVAMRYRAGDAAVRAQLRWIGLAVLVFGMTVIPFIVGRHVIETSDATGEAIAAAANLGGVALPVAAAVAITRYHLFGVDRLINRTLVYGGLVGVLGGLYAAAVGLFQRVFVAVTGETSDVPMLIAMFLVAGAFTPVRKWLEGIVDRWAHTAPSRTSPSSEAHGREPSSADADGETHGHAAALPVTPDLFGLNRFGALLSGPASVPALPPGVVRRAIDANGSVDCPKMGLPTPLATCLACPSVRGILLSPPEVRCVEGPA